MARRTNISAEELQWLNHELRALTRVGIPLERGLRVAHGELSGNLGRFAQCLTERLERGERLVDVLTDPQLGLPPVYAAVVAAGIRSGRPTAAFESISRSMAVSLDLRRSMIVALSYPLMVVVLATGLLHFAWTALFPVIWELVPAILEREPPPWFHWLAWSVEHRAAALIVMWMIVAAVVGWWFGLFRWLGLSQREGVLAGVTTASRSAVFAETLALLLEQEVPLDESLELAGVASDQARLRQSSLALAAEVRAGGNGDGLRDNYLPALMSWLVLTHSPGPMMIRCLRQTAASQREKAEDISRWLGSMLPLFGSVVVGLLLASYYAWMIMVPYIYLIRGLS